MTTANPQTYTKTTPRRMSSLTQLSIAVFATFIVFQTIISVAGIIG